ncbi:MAG: hypothetical protein NVS2B8_12240 [Vulcanimicrobiaceae bacterium]
MQTELIETGSLQRSLEALLFVASEALSIDRMVKLTGAAHVDVAETLQHLAEAYAERGIVLREVAGGYRFATSPAARAVVEAYLLPTKTNLSPAAMETLAIVAYLQPATRAEIEAVRGVNVDSVVNTLVDRRFIVEAGRRDVAGRPMEYRTTPEFLESFGLRSLAELPVVDLEAEARELTLALPVATEVAPAATDDVPASQDDALPRSMPSEPDSSDLPDEVVELVTAVSDEADAHATRARTFAEPHDAAPPEEPAGATSDAAPAEEEASPFQNS